MYFVDRTIRSNVICITVMILCWHTCQTLVLQIKDNFLLLNAPNKCSIQSPPFNVSINTPPWFTSGSQHLLKHPSCFLVLICESDRRVCQIKRGFVIILCVQQWLWLSSLQLWSWHSLPFPCFRQWLVFNNVQELHT